MSWSIYATNATVEDAESAVTNSSAPQEIMTYHMIGISGLVAHHGENVRVNIASHGHLCDSANTYEVTTAQIEVKKAAEEPSAE